MQQRHLQDSIVFLQSGETPEEKLTYSAQHYEPDGLFYWLSGWDQPDTCLVLLPKIGEAILITPVYDKNYATWHGSILTEAEIKQKTGVQRVIQSDDIEATYKKIKIHEKANHAFNYESDNFILCVALARRVKFPDEIECLSKASDITAKALIEVIKFCKPRITEKALEAAFFFHGTLLGGDGLSFPTIVASGPNSPFLHYMEGARTIENGDLIVFDCGFRYFRYAGDVTRTFPANGKFTDIQKDVYNALLKLQVQLINGVKPGANINKLEMAMNIGVFMILKQFEIVSATTKFDSDIASLFIPHALSHHIGTSEHDLVEYETKHSDYEDVSILKPGYIITIEPGIYFNPFLIKDTDLAINKERALQLYELVGGIRIEDDVEVTNDGYRVLSAACPKTVEEIEALMNHE